MDVKSSIKRLYDSGGLHVTIGTFATKFVAFFGSIVVVRLLSKEDYGLMSYVENIYSYAFVFAGLGLSNGMLRFLVITEDEREKKGFFGYIIRRSALIDIVIALLLCAFALLWDIPGNYLAARYLIVVLALLLPFQDLLNELLMAIRSFFENKLYAYLAFGSSVLLIAGRVVGAVAGSVGGVLWSRVIINAAFSVLLLAYMARRFFPGERAKELGREQKRAVNSYSLQYMITNGFWALFMLNDTFLLGMLLNDPSGLADYKVACVLPGNISIFATAIGVFVSPYFMKHERDAGWVRRNFKKVYLVSAVVVGAVAALIAALAEPLIGLMYGEQYMNVAGLMRALLLAAFLNSGIRFTTANLLASMGQVRYNMITSGVGIVVQVALDLLLIPQMGVMAVAVTSCMVYLAMGVYLLFVFIRKYYREPTRGDRHGSGE